MKVDQERNEIMQRETGRYWHLLNALQEIVETKKGRGYDFKVRLRDYFYQSGFHNNYVQMAETFMELYHASFRTDRFDGWFFKTHAWFWDHHRLSRGVVDSARENFKRCNPMLVEERHGFRNRLEFRIVPGNVIAALYPEALDQSPELTEMIQSAGLQQRQNDGPSLREPLTPVCGNPSNYPAELPQTQLIEEEEKQNRASGVPPDVDDFAYANREERNAESSSSPSLSRYGPSGEGPNEAIVHKISEYTPKESEPTQRQRQDLRFLVDKHYGGDWNAMWLDFPEYDSYSYTRAEADTLIATLRAEHEEKRAAPKPNPKEVPYGQRALDLYKREVVEYLNLPPLTDKQCKRFAREFSTLHDCRGADKATIFAVFYRMIESMQQDPMYPDPLSPLRAYDDVRREPEHYPPMTPEDFKGHREIFKELADIGHLPQRNRVLNLPPISPDGARHHEEDCGCFECDRLAPTYIPMSEAGVA